MRLARLAALAATTTVALCALAPAAGAAGAPAWEASSLATPTNFAPGGTGTYDVRATNVGGAGTTGDPITILDTLPQGLEYAPGSAELQVRFWKEGEALPELHDFGPECSDEELSPGQVTLSCTIEQLPEDKLQTAVLAPLEEVQLLIPVTVPGALAEGTELTNQVQVSGGGAGQATATSHNEASSAPAPSGFSYYRAGLSDEAGQPQTQAGSHPFQFTTSFALNTEPGEAAATTGPCVPKLCVPAGGDLKDVRVALPPGLVGNPNAITKCTAQQFTTVVGRSLPSGFYSETACPNSSVVGVVNLKDVEGEALVFPTPLYNLVPEPGSPAQFGFQYGNLPFYIDAELRSGSDYGIDGVVRNTSQAKRVSAATVTFWGNPADPRHDPLRGSCLIPGFKEWGFSREDEECPYEAPTQPKPFFRLPTNCSQPMDVTMGFDSWTAPGSFIAQTSPALAPGGCAALGFEPTLKARPTTDLADSPAGLHAALHIPQAEHEDPAGTGQADLREVKVQLPPGLVINPSGANGLQACTPAQIALHSAAPASCPAAARLGEVEVNTPLVDHPLPGSVYAATPHENPFGTLLAIYLAVHDPVSGVVVKLAGRVDADPASGQLRATFAENPQTPFEDFTLEFFGGPGAALRSPAVCGDYATESTLTPWSAPFSGPPVSYRDSYAITRAPGGGGCPRSAAQLPNAPTFEAGSLAPIAFAFSPFTTAISRPDGSQELETVRFSPPPGLLAKLAGVPYCPESALADTAAKSGRAEQSNPSCPGASRIGTVAVAAGAGPAPYNTTGTVYWAGPYRGAPFSVAIVTPAAAGPYDLGTVVLRVPLYVDRETAQVTAVSDPIPHILQGIPLDVRSATVTLDRPEFTVNPTSCDPMEVSGSETSTQGNTAPIAVRFQVGECGRLKFPPKLSFRLKGGTRRSAHPALQAVLRFPPGENTNISRAVVAFPHSEFLENAHFRTICTRVQFAADACPKGSIYGRASAKSPLLDYTVRGPVYLRSSSNPLPDLVFALKGPPSQPVEVDVVARIDSVNGGIRTTLDSVPDVPVSKFVLRMQGGRKGLLVNSRDICKHRNRVRVKLDAHSGRVKDSRPLLKARCKRHRKKGKGHHRSGKAKPGHAKHKGRR